MSSERVQSRCGEVRDRFPEWGLDALDDARRGAVREHLTACADCRSRLGRIDPSVLFLDLRGGPLPAAFWRGFDADLKARLAAGAARPGARLAGWLETLRAPRVAWLAPAAMLLLVAATLFLVRPDAFRPAPPAPRVEGIQSPYAPPGGSRLGGDGARPEMPAGARSRLAADRAASDLPLLEEVASPAARVYRFEGAGDDPTAIYLVVDESIDF